MGGMMEMMEGMHGTPQKELYPSLMALPELTPEKKAELSALAHERMTAGTAIMSEGLKRLSDTAPGNDFAAMQLATTQVRDGLDQFNSGLAAHRAIAEGKAPREVALQWFKDQMNMAQPAVAVPQGTGPMGLSWLHFWAMAALVVFTVAMLWMYFFKMRRASLLLQAVAGVGGIRTDSTIGVEVGSKQSSSSRPLSKNWSGQLRVGRIFQETPDVKTFRLMNPLGGVLPFSYLPGQFLTVTVPGADGKPTKRSYTIASSPTQQDYAELTVKHQPDGLVSAFLDTQVKEGDLLECSGPAGSFIFTGRECKCILLIGAGVGITPLMSVARYLLDRSWGGDIFLVYSCRTPKDIIFKEELEYLQHRHANLRVIITISRPEGTEWKGTTGRITKELITASVPDVGSRYVHICGPVPMMESTKQILADLGVPGERIKTEAFGPALGKIERTVQGDVSGGDRGMETKAHAIPLPTVKFTKSDKAAPFPPNKVVLEVAEEIGVDIDYSCRVGTCGVCRVKLLSGEVTMAVEDGLQPGDKEKGIILACQAKSTGNLTVEA